MGNGSKSLTIWAHNGGGNDYLLMFPEHPFSVFEDGGLWVESKLLLGLIRLNRRQCLRFRDTLSLFPSTTLAELGRAVKMEKGITPSDFIDGSPRPLTEEDYDYCFLDCEILLAFLQRFRSTLWEHRQIAPGLTVAQTAMRDYATNCLSEPIFIREPEDDWCAPAYFGGRGETYFRKTVQALWKYDVNSMYPYVMASGAYPDPSALTFVGPQTPDTAIDLLERCEGVLDVAIDVPPIERPPLPAVVDDVLRFGWGSLRGRWTFPEIRHALSVGATIERCYGGVVAPAVPSPFLSYVGFWYALRQTAKADGDIATATTAKYLLNSLYGKFGQRPRGVSVPGSFSDDPPFAGAEFTFADAETERGYWSNDADATRPSHRIVSWAAYTTAMARVHLARLMDRCERVVYCDTDSLVTDTLLPTDPTTLGALKLEAKVVEGVFLAPKRYWFIDGDGQEHMVFKGVPKADPRESRHTFVRVHKARESWRHNVVPGSRIAVTKMHELNEKKRLWKTDGSSAPIRA